MLPVNPHIITDNGTQYSLGTLDKNIIRYDFKKMLFFLEAKGKMLFGERFRIYKKDRKVLYKLCAYVIGDKVKCAEYGLDLTKGVLLAGPVGCGKTSLLTLIRYMVPHQRSYEVVSTRDMIWSYSRIGYKVIEDYGNSGFFCFDDLGAELMGRFYGKECNVMREVLLSRYDLFRQSKRKVKTHATTNLSAEELEEVYGTRVCSRMRELFNWIVFEQTSVDKRS